MQKYRRSICGVNTDVSRYVLIHTFTHSILLQTHPPTQIPTHSCDAGHSLWQVVQREKNGQLQLKGSSKCVCVSVCAFLCMFSGLHWVIRLGDFSQGREGVEGWRVGGIEWYEKKKIKGKTLRRKKGHVVPVGLCMHVSSALEGVHSRICVYVREVEKAVALRRGRALLSLAEGVRGRGRVGGGHARLCERCSCAHSRGIWVQGVGGGVGVVVSPGGQVLHWSTSSRSRWEEKNSTKKQAQRSKTQTRLCPSVHCPSIPHSSAPPLRHFSPLFPQIGKINK